MSRNFCEEQPCKQKTDVLRSLFSQLVEKSTQSIQLIMIYGLLNRRIRKRIMRKDITSFHNLIQRAGTVERNLFRV